VGAAERRAARAAAVSPWQEPEPQHRDSGLSVGKDYGSGRQRARLRSRKESARHKAPFAGGHGGVGLEGQGTQRQGARPGWVEAALLESARAGLLRLKHLWLEAGYQGRGRKWVEEVMGLSVEVVRKPQKPVPEKIAKLWAQQWAKEGKEVNWQRLMAPRGFQVLPRRWVVERTLAWIGHNRRMAKDYERLCATGEAFVYVAMSRLMVRRLARA
jgi:hypothetical protein